MLYAQLGVQSRDPARHPSHEYILHLLRQAETHRELASNCRRVAPSVSLEGNRASLIAYAEELERQAAKLEDQAARLR